MNQKSLEHLPSPEGMDRTEILHLLLSEEYGFLPDPPAGMTVNIETEENNFCAGKAILKKLKINCDTGHGVFSFPVSLMYPSKIEKPVPCFILINFRDLVPDRYFPAEEILDNGFAALTFCYQDISTDDGDFTNGLAGMVYPDGKRTSSQCGKIGLWAWAAMRVMDYAVTLPFLDTEHISIVGHSRLGKTALLTGALDQRFFCSFSNDSGCSGAALSREKAGETIRDICTTYPYWFCEAYKKYAGHEEDLPFDQHFLLAASAPRHVYVASASEDLWACPENEYLSCIAAGRYYQEMGRNGFIHPDRLPVPGDCFTDGDIGYHMRSGTHYLSREDWNYFMKFIRKKD